MKLISQVIISEDIEGTIATLEAIKTDEIFIKIVKEDRFLVEDAKIAIEKAYVTYDVTTVLILAAKSFDSIVQNKLLKILEEPPPNKIFILIAAQKGAILETIRSRLPLYSSTSNLPSKESPLDMKSLSLAAVYSFVQSLQYTSLSEGKQLLELILVDAMKSECYNLDAKSLSLFSDATRALTFGSPPQFVLSAVLLKLLANKKNKSPKGALSANV